MSGVARELSLNWFITIPFPYIMNDGKRYRSKKDDLPTFVGLIEAYANMLATRGVKRLKRERLPDEWLPIIAVPEYRTKAGEDTFPHWHCLVRFPEGQEAELLKLSSEFWQKQGQKHCGGPVIPHFEPAYDIAGVSDYSLKWLEDQVTLENTIVRGVGLRFKSKI
jgi:hypothetical protein